MGAAATLPILRLSPFTDEDTDGIAMLTDHAYLAQSDGEVIAYVTSTGGNQHISGFVGDTDNPEGAGSRLITNGTDPVGAYGGISFTVARGEYFEITRGAQTNVAVIHWRSFGPLINPVDFN